MKRCGGEMERMRKRKWNRGERKTLEEGTKGVIDY